MKHEIISVTCLFLGSLWLESYVNKFNKTLFFPQFLFFVLSLLKLAPSQA